MNKILETRKSIGLTQQALANLVNTSQQHIARLEKGKSQVRLDLAIQISTALNKPLEVIFPGISKALRNQPLQIGVSNIDAGLGRNVSNYDDSAKAWTFRALLKGHSKCMDFPISSGEYKRLFKLVQDERTDADCSQFIVFESLRLMVAVKLDELVYCHFLFDSISCKDLEEVCDEKSNGANVYISGQADPLNFEVDIDEGDPEDENDEGQFRNILGMLEHLIEKSQRIYFTDSGESVFIRAGDMAMLTVPLYIVVPTFQVED